MGSFKNLLASTALIAWAGSAQAVIIDFVDLTENVLGESGWSTLSFAASDFSLDITAKKGTADAFAYLDYKHAGLGVCGTLNDLGEGVQGVGSKVNTCAPSSDDNVTGIIGGAVESLIFTFDTDVTINRIWFNNTHDPDRYIGGPGHESDRIDINGSAETPIGNGYAPGSIYNTEDNYKSSADNFLGPYAADIASATPRTLTIAFNNQQFYISAMEVTTVPSDENVPVPAPLALLGIGLAGLGLVRRKKA